MKRITYLDGLKGLAALVVVLHHFSLAFYPAIYTRSPGEVHTGLKWELILYGTPFNIFLNGNFALLVFLLLSGFALSYKYFQTKDLSILTATVIKRYFRLLPPIIFSNFLAFGIIDLGGNFALRASKITGSWWWLGKTWVFTPNFVIMLRQTFIDLFIKVIDQPVAYNSSLWIIPIFFLGTFLITGTLALVGSYKYRYLIYSILCVYFLNTYYFPLILGMWLCDLFVNHHEALVKITQPAISLLFLLIALYLGSFPTDNSSGQLVGTIYALLPLDKEIDMVIFYHSLGALAFVTGIFCSTGLKRFFMIRPLLFLGKISYSLFVVHVVILASLGSFFFLTFSPLFTYSQAVILMLLITIPLTLFSAYMINRWLELPGLRLTDFICRRFTKS